MHKLRRNYFSCEQFWPVAYRFQNKVNIFEYFLVHLKEFHNHIQEPDEFTNKGILELKLQFLCQTNQLYINLHGERNICKPERLFKF